MLAYVCMYPRTHVRTESLPNVLHDQKPSSSLTQLRKRHLHVKVQS